MFRSLWQCRKCAHSRHVGNYDYNYFPIWFLLRLIITSPPSLFVYLTHLNWTNNFLTTITLLYVGAGPSAWLLFLIASLMEPLSPVPVGLAFLQACCIPLGLGFAFHCPGNSLSPSPGCLRLIFVSLFPFGETSDQGTWEEKVLRPCMTEMPFLPTLLTSYRMLDWKEFSLEF